MSDRRWSVLIPHRGQPTTVQFPDTRVLAHAGPTIGCEWVEAVAPLGLAVTKHRLLVDESGAITNADRNPLASFLYGSHLHGQHIYGNALVCTQVTTSKGPDLVWLTYEEAMELVTKFFPSKEQ